MTILRGFYIFLFMLLFQLAPFANAQSVLETDVLKPVVGQQESIVGARVDKVEADGEVIKVTVSIPTISGEMEEVVVYGSRTISDQPRAELPQIKRYEVVNNIEHGRSGVVIYLGKSENFVLKFNYTDDQSSQGVGHH